MRAVIVERADRREVITFTDKPRAERAAVREEMGLFSLGGTIEDPGERYMEETHLPAPVAP